MTTATYVSREKDRYAKLAINSFESLSNITSRLGTAFYWHETPQGDMFWQKLMYYISTEGKEKYRVIEFEDAVIEYAEWVKKEREEEEKREVEETHKRELEYLKEKIKGRLLKGDKIKVGDIFDAIPIEVMKKALEEYENDIPF